jgi:4'-phosphopantetheinyl transferase
MSDPTDVWLISCAGADDPGCLDILSEEEHRRASSFVFAEHRRRYVQAHVCLRQILSQYMSISAGSLKFRYTESGKPSLENTGGSSPLNFNLSHSAELAVVAVTTAPEIGVDVEQIRPIPEWEDISRSTFHPDEADWVRSHPADRRNEAFFQVWTAKEAYVKASGLGLAHPLDSFSVVGSAPQQEYIVTRLDLPSGYAGAVAHPPPWRGIRQKWWQAK